MFIQNLVKFCPFVLKILSGNEILTSIKGHYSATNLRKMTVYHPNLDLINVIVYTKFDFCPFILKILGGNKILTSVKGRNSVKNMQKLTVNNSKVDLVNMNMNTKFG